MRVSPLRKADISKTERARVLWDKKQTHIKFGPEQAFSLSLFFSFLTQQKSCNENEKVRK